MKIVASACMGLALGLTAFALAAAPAQAFQAPDLAAASPSAAIKVYDRDHRGDHGYDRDRHHGGHGWRERERAEREARERRERCEHVRHRCHREHPFSRHMFHRCMERHGCER